MRFFSLFFCKIDFLVFFQRKSGDGKDEQLSVEMSIIPFFCVDTTFQMGRRAFINGPDG